MDINDTNKWNIVDKQIVERLKHSENIEEENLILGTMIKKLLENSLGKKDKIEMKEEIS